MQVNAYAAHTATTPLKPHTITRRSVLPNDVAIDIAYCGVCHSDIHQARDEWGGSIFPMVPGHEITGIVTDVGSEVTRFKKGDKVGVGCFVDSCRQCASCTDGLEQYCESGMILTYNGRDKNGTPTDGGYSTHIVVDQSYVLRIPENLPLDRAAPLLCAGVTTYSPLRTWGVGPNTRLAIVGLGGLGHMAVKLARALGAHITVITQSLKKKDDALRLGATDVYASSDPATFTALANRFDLILNTVSASIDWNPYLNCLKRDGTMVLLGVPPEAPHVAAFSLIGKRRRLAGSLIGGIRETQEMLDFCSKHTILADIETIAMHEINTAYTRMIEGDVRYRFVIDMASLK